MQKLLENRKFRIIGGTVLGVAVALLLVWAFFQDTYASIKKCGANPPFKGVYWGMTIPEFCEAMGIEESDLIPAEPIPYDEWNGIGKLAKLEEEYKVTADELPLYEHYENQFDLQLTEEILGTTDYHLGDKAQTIRVVFTDETVWNGKNIPPLLCFILCEIPYDQMWSTSNELSLYYFNEELPENAFSTSKNGFLNPKTTHRAALKLSTMFSGGMDMEKIESYDFSSMTDDEIKSIPCQSYEAIRPRDPIITISSKVDDLGWGLVPNFETAYIMMTGGQLAYYEWFLNELT